MEEPRKEKPEEDFLKNPKIIEHYTLLQEIGFFNYINTQNSAIRDYKRLLTGGLEIIDHTTIDEILNTTVWKISDHCLPSLITFLWKPIQNKDVITIKAYKNYKQVNLHLDVNSIAPFEDFFRQYPKPINFELMAFELNNDKAIAPFLPVRPELFIPILGPLGLYGIIVVSSKVLGKEYSPNELLFLQQLMSFVSLAIKNHLHYEHSLHDVKTGLFNHGFFMTRLAEEVARSKRAECDSSLIVIDVDKFKNFNDSYGHLAGDSVLEQLALVLKQCVRNEDIPSRFGGEEFTVLLPNTDKPTAWQIAERLRLAVASMAVPWETPLPQVTISLGIAVFNHENDVDAAEVIRRADEALYLSKERGRNRCTIWGSGLLNKIMRRGLAEP